jgi:hypothetical protein
VTLPRRFEEARVSSQRFDFAFDRRFAPVLALLGVRPSTSVVVLDDDGFHARFGPFRLDTSWDNVTDVQVTRGYRWFKAIGPRGSLADRGATFGTNAEAGTCVCFETPLPALAGRLLLHPALTVTVADPEALASAIRQRLSP